MQLRSQQEGGAEVRFAEHSDEVAEAEQVAAEVRAMMDAGTPAREIAVLFRINAQSEAFEEAFAARGVPYVLRGAARFFERAEVKQAVTLLRGNARSGAGTGAELAAEVRAVLAGMGWSEKAPTGRGNVRDRWESLQAIVSQAEDFLTAQPESGPRRLRRRARPARRRAARTRSPRASRWRRCTPPRASSGTSCSWPACTRARCRSSTPTPPPRSRRSAGCSTSA